MFLPLVYLMKKQKCFLCLERREFQVAVWGQLLQILLGSLTTYGVVFEEIQKIKASKAVGTAIGGGSVVFSILCHSILIIEIDSKEYYDWVK